jgi:hypothetical protein
VVEEGNEKREERNGENVEIRKCENVEIVNQKVKRRNGEALKRRSMANFVIPSGMTSIVAWG